MLKKNRDFDPVSYQENDPRAKQAFRAYLLGQGFYDIHIIEDYYFDISAKYKGKKHYFEVEVKNQWSDSWPSSWTELRIPGRKKRLIQKHKDLHTNTTLTFIVLNTDLTKAWVVDSDVLESSPIGTIQNSSRVGAPHLKEPFFHVPISDARGIFLKKG